MLGIRARLLLCQGDLCKRTEGLIKPHLVNTGLTQFFWLKDHLTTQHSYNSSITLIILNCFYISSVLTQNLIICNNQYVWQDDPI